MIRVQEKRADVLVVSEGSLGASNRNELVSLAAENRLSALYPYPEFPAEGGLMFYGANTTDQFRRAAVFVDKLFKGAKPADLPVEQPIKFGLFVNARTAKTLGLAIPYSILLRATKVIE